MPRAGYKRKAVYGPRSANGEAETRLLIPCTTALKQRVADAARAAGIPVSAYVRNALTAALTA